MWARFMRQTLTGAVGKWDQISDVQEKQFFIRLFAEDFKQGIGGAEVESAVGLEATSKWNKGPKPWTGKRRANWEHIISRCSQKSVRDD